MSFPVEKVFMSLILFPSVQYGEEFIYIEIHTDEKECVMAFHSLGAASKVSIAVKMEIQRKNVTTCFQWTDKFRIFSSFLIL